MSLKVYPCPTCQKPAAFEPSNLFRPFCCERCKMIDLGEWASESYKLTGKPVANDQEDETDLT